MYLVASWCVIMLFKFLIDKEIRLIENTMLHVPNLLYCHVLLIHYSIEKKKLIKILTNTTSNNKLPINDRTDSVHTFVFCVN